MENQKLQLSSEKKIAKRRFVELFILSRYKGDEIEITEMERDEILGNIALGTKLIQLGKITIMTSNIAGIDPKWTENELGEIRRIHKEHYGI